MNKKLSILLCIVLVLMTVLGGCGSANKNIRMGAGDIGGIYYSFSGAFAGIFNQDNTASKIELKNTAGSAANIRLLSGRYIDLGIAQMDIADSAYNGNEPSDEKKYQGYKAIATLYTEACQIVVKEDSDIYSLNDLQGKTVSIGSEESGSESNAKQILKYSGLTDEIIKTVNLDYSDAAQEFTAGKIDALFITAGIKTTVIEELSKECDVRLLNIDDNCMDKLKAACPFYSEYIIPAYTYNGQTESVKTLGVKSVLLASDSLSKDTVKQITSSLFDNSKQLQYATSVDLNLNISNAAEGITIPFHAGAAAYYSEHGIDVITE